jgi:hypothetical protein
MALTPEAGSGLLVAPLGRGRERRTGVEAIIVLMVVLAIGGIVYGMYATAERRKALSAWASAHGMRFSPDRDRSLEGRFGGFNCLRCGHSRYARNLIEGEWNGRGFLGFDYHYETGSGKNRQTHNFSGVILDSHVPLKPLLIRPEGFFDKVTEFFGLDDIDFESAEFSRKFFVKSPDRKWAYDVIHQQTMEFLLAGPRFSLQFDWGHVIAYRGSRLKPEEFGAAADVVAGVLERLPEYLVRQQVGGG